MRITRLLLMAIVLSIVTHTALYAQKYTAASQISSSGTYNLVESEFDNSGNLIMAGNFTGNITIGGKSVSSAGGQDIFIACFNTSMVCYQLLQFGGNGSETVSALTTDASNNIYFAGPGSNGIKIGSYTFSSNGAFLAKLNSSGSVQFVATYLNNGTNVTSTTSCGSSPGCSISATNSYTYVNSADIAEISVDASGNIYFTGTYKGSLTETGTGAYTTSSPQAVCNGPSPCGTRYKNYTAFYYGYNTAFAGKISSSGSKVWTQKYGGSLNDNSTGNTITASNNAVYFTYNDNKTLNTPIVMITRLTAAGGIVSWTRSYSSTFINEGVIDSRSNFIFTGYYKGKTGAFYIFNNISNYTGTGSFVHRFDSRGNVRNAMPFYNSSTNSVNTNTVINIDAQDRIYVSGTAENQIYGNTILRGKGGESQFVVRIDSSFKYTKHSLAGGDVGTSVNPFSIRLISNKVNLLSSVNGTVSFDSINVNGGTGSLYWLQMDTAKYSPPTSIDSLVSGEYFFNDDPGLGKGQVFTFAPKADTVSLKLKANISALPDGFNELFVRIKSKSGLWSHYEARVFYIQGKVVRLTAGDTLVKAEYFFDNDPGLGKGITINFTAAKDSVAFKGTAKINTLSEGFHNLFVRVQNKAGKWSHYEGRTFYKKADQKLNIAAKIVDGEYFFDTDPGVGKGTKISPAFSSADIIDITRLASTSGLAVGKHMMYVRLRDSLGRWSLTEGNSFNICSNPLPVPTVSGKTSYCPGETIQLNGNNVTGASSYLWKGPNNFTSTLQNITITNITADKAGKYSFIAIRSGGTACDTSSPVIVNVILNAPGVAQSLSVSGTASFCSGGSVLLSTNQVSGFRYRWLISGSNTSNPGDTTNSLIVTTGGRYNVRITNTSGCSYLMRDTVITVFVKPATSNISGNSNVLINSTENYSVNNTSGSTYAWFVNNGTLTSGNGTNNISVDWPNQAGTCTVKVIETNANGCIGDTQFLNITISRHILNVNPKSLDYIAAGESKSVTVSCDTSWSATTDQPSWVTINPANGSGNGNVSIAVSANTSQAKRNATVTFTAGALTHIVNVTQDFTSGIGETSEISGIKVFPNPSAGLFTVKNKLEKRADVRVYDATGRIVDNFVMQPSGSIKLDYSHLSPAVYIMSIITEKGIMLQQLVITK